MRMNLKEFTNYASFGKMMDLDSEKMTFSRDATQKVLRIIAGLNNDYLQLNEISALFEKLTGNEVGNLCMHGGIEIRQLYGRINQ
jgi:hypothetical protein